VQNLEKLAKNWVLKKRTWNLICTVQLIVLLPEEFAT